ncbi:MAG: phosphatidate cytidylyltransferase [Candidatus Zixiibacteriota bacterium]|nr:MAG: phosphatidate cytidylyltransferase [candidate division Zixibacteria bacterium]
MSSNLITRIAVAAITIPIILWICYQGGAWLFGMVLLFALMAIVEFLLNEGHRPTGVFFWLATVCVALMLLSRFEDAARWFWLQYLFSGVSGILLFFLLTAMIFSTGKRPAAELFSGHTRLAWGVLYIGLLYPYVYFLGGQTSRLTPFHPSGGDWLLFLFGLLWVGDTAAMGVGKWIGRHKLAPSVSPNKTVEGFIGGILGALAVGVIMYFWKFHDVAWYHLMILAAGCSVFGQLGDLVESMWKRSVGIKDSSPVIPGHGGVLDRFDSLLFAAPFMFYYRLLLAVQ